MPSISLLPPCPPNEPGAPMINAWILVAARRCHKARIPAERAVGKIRRAMTRPEKFPTEVSRTVERVYNETLPNAVSTGQRVSALEFDADLLKQYAANVPFEITTDWLRDRSERVDISPAQFLDAIFPNERACVTTTPLRKDCFIYDRDASELNDYASKNKEGAWFVSNPVNGVSVNDSFRSEANLTDFRHLVLESDTAERSQWLAVLVLLHAPILAIYESGRRSIHALVRIDAPSREAFDEIADFYKRSLVPLGADPKAITAVRLTRLPNVMRNDNQRVQRLLYLNPQGTNQPIITAQNKEAASQATDSFTPLF